MPLDSRLDFIHQFLEDDDSGQEGYNSESDEVHKGSSHPKRRKLQDADASSLGSDQQSEGELECANSRHPAAKSKYIEPKAPEGEDNGQTQSEPDKPKDTGQPTGNPKKKISKLEKEAKRAAIDTKRSGVVYLSRIPPFMKPQKLRSLLEPYGKLNRIYLAIEDPDVRKARVRNGGNKKQSYTEGWVEFVRKSDAKKACDLLNARPIGGKKGSFYYDDIWTLIYLKGFKWSHLTEQMEAENKERESRLRAEIEKTNRENEVFVRNIDKAKMLKNMGRKRKRADNKEAPDNYTKSQEVAATGPKKKKELQPEAKKVISRIL